MYTEGYKNAGDLYKAKTFRTTQLGLSICAIGKKDYMGGICKI